MEVMVSSATLDLELSSAKTSPKGLGACYLSAPTSPSRVSEFYREFDYFSTVHVGDTSPSSIVHKTTVKDKEENESDDGFAFFVSEESEALSVSAEELFDGGKIKALKLDQDFTSLKSPLLGRQSKSPISQGKKVIGDAFSPKKKQERRGRERSVGGSNSGRRTTRSHSPYRVSEYRWEEEEHQIQRKKEESESSSNSSKSSRKWRLRDFLLFRSASEGRGSNKDPFRKFSVLYKKPEQAVKTSNVTSTDSPRRKPPISAHEFHYAIKKAQSQDLKKKTFLPYRQGILGRLAGLGSFAA